MQQDPFADLIPGRGTVLPVDQVKQRRDDASLRNTESTIQDRAADNARQQREFELRLAKDGYMLDANGSIVRNPNFVPELTAAERAEQTKAEGRRNKAQVVKSIMESTIDLYKADLRGQPASRAFGASEYIDGLPRNERFRQSAMGMLALIRPMVAMGPKDGDSDKEMEVFLSYIPNNDDSDLTVEAKFRNLERLLRGVVDGVLPSEVDMSSNTDTPFVDAKLGAGRNDGGAGLSPPPPPEGQESAWDSLPASNNPYTAKLAQGERFSTPEDLAYANEMQATLNSGGSLQDLIRVANKYGRTTAPNVVKGWARVIDYRDGTGEYEGQQTGFSSVIPQKSGRQSALMKAGNDFANSGIGQSAVGFTTGAANAISLGGLDELTAGATSLAKGTNYEDELAYYNFGKNMIFDRAPVSAMAGELAGGVLLGAGAARAAPGVAQTLAGTGTRAFATGTALGGINGALEFNEDRLSGGVAGGVLGGAGGVLGQKVIGPSVEAIAASAPGQAVSRGVRGSLNRIRPNAVAPSALPQTTPDFRAAASALRGSNAVETVNEARALGLPFALADADPKLRSLAGSVSRQSQDARQMAEDTFFPRGLDQASRARDAVNQNFAPILDDPAQRAQDLTRAGSMAADPFYQATYAQRAPQSDVLDSILRTDAGKSALKSARRIAQNEGRNPEELGFVLDAQGEVGLPSMSGRFERVPVGNPRDALTNGNPMDLVSWVRGSGGLRDSGGELASMGVTNKGRSGINFVGQETRLGPLVSDQGMDFDQAAQAAWEAGYFPELSRRPSINEFLDAFRGTYDGNARRFLPEDAPQIEAFNQATAQQHAARKGRFEGAPLSYDNSVPAGPRDFAPLDAYGREVRLPTVETLDYVKRGLDDQINSAMAVNPITGQPISGQSPIARSLQQLRKRFVDEIDAQVPTYKTARAEAQPYIRAREALSRGQAAVRPSVKPRDISNSIEEMGDLELENYRAGFATGLGDMIDGQADVGDPYKRIFGSTSLRDKAGVLFPEGVGRMKRITDFERDMSRTQYETIGGSPTAARQAADEQFTNNMLRVAADGVTDAIATGGTLTAGNAGRFLANVAKDRMRLGFGNRAEERANALAPILFDTTGDLQPLAEVSAYNALRAQRRATARRYGGLFGASAPIAFLPAEQ